MGILEIQTRQLYPIELVITKHSRNKGSAGHRPNSTWRFIHSPMVSEEYGYDRRFGRVLMEGLGVSGLEQWVDNFRVEYGRNPVVMEFMGPVTLLEQLGVPGIYVNWDADLKDGMAFHNSEVGSRVGINSDIEDLEGFLPRLRVALDTFGGVPCLDLIVCKPEGALSSLVDIPEAFYYWYELLTSLLQPGGIALIQGYDNNLQVIYGYKSSLDDFAVRLEEQGNGRLTYREGGMFYMLVENYNGGPLGVFY